MKTYPMNMDLFLESYQGDDMRYGQDYDKYVCDDRDTSEYVQMIQGEYPKVCVNLQTDVR